jgi:hypothetical protein
MRRQGVIPRAEELCWLLSTLAMGMPKGFVSLYEGIVVEFPVFYTSSTLIWGLKSKNSFVVLERKKTFWLPRIGYGIQLRISWFLSHAQL